MADSEQNDLMKIELEDILTKIAKLKGVEHFEVKAHVEALLGDGFVSQFYKGEVLDKDTGQTIKVAVKKVPAWEWDYSKIYLNEIIFYEKVMPALQALQDEAHLPNPFDNTPAMFISGIEAKKEFLALEDLKPQGYVLHDKMKCLDKEHLEFIFRIYGKFHALSFVLRKQNFEKYQEIHQEYTDLFPMFVGMESSVQFFKTALAVAVDALSPDSPVYEAAKDLPENIKANVLKAANYEGNFRCSTHGDCWSNNMLFKYSDSGKVENLKLVDFQLARDGTPVHDLSYFFYSGAAKADLDALEDYLKIYHNSLSKVLKGLGENADEIFPFATLVQEWKENALLGMLLGIYLWQIKLVPKQEVVDTLTDDSMKTGENGEATMDKAIEAITNMMGKATKNELFRERSRDILTQAFEYGVLKKENIVYEPETTPASLENVSA